MTKANTMTIDYLKEDSTRPIFRSYLITSIREILERNLIDMQIIFSMIMKPSFFGPFNQETIANDVIVSEDRVVLCVLQQM